MLQKLKIYRGEERPAQKRRKYNAKKLISPFNIKESAYKEGYRYKPYKYEPASTVRHLKGVTVNKEHNADVPNRNDKQYPNRYLFAHLHLAKASRLIFL